MKRALPLLRANVENDNQESVCDSSLIDGSLTNTLSQFGERLVLLALVTSYFKIVEFVKVSFSVLFVPLFGKAMLKHLGTLICFCCC